MKVAFDHRIFSMQRYGGVSRYFFELASRLPLAAGTDVQVVAPMYINNYLTADSARSFVSGKYIANDFPGLPHIVGLANRCASPFAWSTVNADIVHETYFNLLPVGKASQRVVTVYDMIHELFLPNVKRVIAAKRAAVKRADHVICISETTQRDLIRLHDIDPARTSVVHLGYSLTSGMDDQKLPRIERRPSILYVGSRGGYKNFDALLQAFGSSSLLREFDLIAFGGQPWQPAELKEIERLGLTDRVQLRSGSDQDLAACYRAAVAFVYPSLYEGFGIPPLEAMSYGCPVVCSNAGAIPEVVGNAGLYFDPNSSAELRSNLEILVASEEMQTNLQLAGLARISAFSWDRCAEETAQIYRKLM